MPHDLDLVFTLAGGLTAALGLGFLTHRLGLSPIVGYLLAGIAVGPFTPGFVASGHLAEQLAEIGVILLMFGVGLHLHVRDLLSVRRVAVPGAFAQIAAATALGVAVGRFAGFSLGPSILFGLAISVASTVVLTRVLSDARELHSPAGHLAIGWLVLEDIFTVLVLVVLPDIADPEAAKGPLGLGLAVLVALAKLTALGALAALLGRRAIPGLLAFAAKSGSRELFTLAVLVLALGIAVGSATLFGASMALGAFLAGMVVGQSEFSSRAAAEALPMRDAFAVLFFVSVGMLLDPAHLLAAAPVAALTLAVVVLAKPAVAAFAAIVLKQPPRTAVTVGLALAQIGEFSFILASQGKRFDLFPEEASRVLVVVAIVSIAINPLLFALRGQMTRALARVAPGPRSEGTVNPNGQDHRAVVVGAGPVGLALIQILRDNGIAPVVVEMNLETSRALREAGVDAIFGDAGQMETLEHAGIRGAKSLLLTAAGPAEGEAIRHAKDANPSLFVLARTAFLGEAAALRRAGADVIVTGESEVALAMAERLLERLGATPEQLERERERVRSGLVDATQPRTR